MALLAQGYPTAYRRGSVTTPELVPGGRGFQPPARVNSRRSGRRPPPIRPPGATLDIGTAVLPSKPGSRRTFGAPDVPDFLSYGGGIRPDDHRSIPKNLRPFANNLPSMKGLGRMAPAFRAFALANELYTVGRYHLGAYHYGGYTMPSSHGWTPYGKCAAFKGSEDGFWLPGGTGYRSFLANQAINCSSGQSLSNVYDITKWGVTPGTRSIVFTQQTTFPPYSPRYRIIQYFWRAANGAVNSFPVPLTRIFGSFPWPAPRPASLGGYGYRPPPPTIQSSLYGGPTITVTSGGVKSHWASSNVGRYKPPPKTVEKKFIMAVHNRSAVGRVMGFHGELGDFTESFYSTLPRYLKSKDADKLYQRQAIVLNNLHRIDFRESLKNLALNHQEDMVVGAQGRVVAKINFVIGTPIGLGTLRTLSQGEKPSALGFFF